jgi:hypothetical protein
MAAGGGSAWAMGDERGGADVAVDILSPIYLFMRNAFTVS